jgi:uncharacterized protein (DUF1697 family)
MRRPLGRKSDFQSQLSCYNRRQVSHSVRRLQKDMMKFVAFIRNINIGQTGFPNRSQLENAFLASGAHDVVSFQSNGTVVFDLAYDASFLSFKVTLGEALRPYLNFSEPFFIRNLEAIKSAIQQNPFAVISWQDYPHKYVSYYDCSDWNDGILPLESPKKDCLVFNGNGEVAYSVAKDINGISGYPTPLLEKILRIPVTTRSWRTIERLSSKF